MTVVEQVAAARRMIQRVLAERLARSTPRPVLQLFALRVIARGEIQKQSELAERLLIDAPSASRLVQRLERDGLLCRAVGADRRCATLSVTREAAPLVSHVDDALAWMNAELGREFTSEELATLDALLSRVRAAFPGM